MTIRKAFVESTYGHENAYKRMWPGEEMLEPPAKEGAVTRVIL